jgi:hypothetical protein
MRDMLVVELVERVLVDVLDVAPEAVLPWATVTGDLGATAGDVAVVLQRLEPVLPASAAERLVRGRSGAFTVDDLVALAESRTRYDRSRVRRALAQSLVAGGVTGAAAATGGGRRTAASA